jgi:copper(I)-binding protein
MKRLLLVTFVLAMCLGGGVRAQDYTAGSILVDHLWGRAGAGNRPAAVFLTIRNRGDAADSLIAASSPIAEKVELHTHRMEDGIMRMRRIERIDVGAGETVELAPGGLHIMMFGLTEKPEKESLRPLTLTFERAGPVDVMVRFQPLGAEGKGKGGMSHGDNSGNGQKKAE